MTAGRIALRHFDKVFFAGIAAWLLQSGVSSALPSAELGTARATNEKLVAISSYIDEASPSRPDAPTWAEQLRDRIDPARVPAIEAKTFPSWLAWRRPNLAFITHHPDCPPKPVPIARAPQELAGVVERSSVKLSWQLDPDNQYVFIDSFTVERRELPGGDWTQLAELMRDPTREAPPLGFTDERVLPRRRYEYRLTQRATPEDRPDLVKVTLAPLSITWTLPSRIAPDLVVVPVHGSVVQPTPDQARRGIGPSVSLRVFKRSGADWLEKQYFEVRAGSNIGRVERVAGHDLDLSGTELLDARSERRQLGGVERRVDVIRFRWLDTGEEEETDDLGAPTRK
jgi:hypothetical protein